MKTIAVLLSIDTKEAEARFFKAYIESHGCKCLTIDMSTRGEYAFQADITREEVFWAGGTKLQDIAGQPKNVFVQAMMDGAKAIIPKLYAEGAFDGILSAGGLQNTLAATGAMQTLPIGVPKLMVSTVACGGRTFEPLVGIKDITLVPSIADITGINAVSEAVLSNAAAAMIGMVAQARPLSADGKMRVGTTLMGVTNDSAVQATAILERQGIETISFHSTGVGGRCLEYLIEQGIIKAVMDLSVHEITAGDVFGVGFSAGAKNRLQAGIKAGIPMVVAPGALDFVDMAFDEFQAGAIGDYKLRKYNLHNNKIAHIKVFAGEAKRAAALMVERLNGATAPVTVLLPLKGMRFDTQPGQSLYDPEVDETILSVLRRGLKKSIRQVEVDANLCDLAFSEVAAAEISKLIQNEK